ncbi:MAG: hypothetical protein L0Y75_07820, partial [Acidobacteria bacterium]|nr:hypothetical protein [Acidobacteriota bacterium]
TNELGFYRVTALEPGSYAVRVEKTGFGGIEARDIVVRSAQEVTYDAEMKVSTISEVVDVSAQAEAISLNKTTPTIGLTATSRQAVELPLSAGRTVNTLALLSPNTFAAPGSTGISSNGQRARNNNFTIDGSDNNDISVTLSTTPIIPEAVGEFQIQTNAYSAEFGRNSGAQINVITKSGTNNFRGDVFEFYRGSALNALDNIEKESGLTRPTRFNRNQFGFDLGGPIIKDRTFVFGLMQGDRTRNGNALGPTIRVPTAAGFAALNNVPLRTGQSQASRQAVLSAIGFLNDAVYSLNPAFRNLQNTNVNGVAIETGQVNLPNSQPNNTWNFIIRGDHRLREGDNLTLRYTYNKPVDSNVASNTQFGSLFAGAQNILDQNAAISETHIFTPNLINEFRVSYIRRNLQFPENDPTTPTAGISGLFTIGGASNFPQGRIQNSYQFSDVLSWQKSRHALKFGLDVRHIRLFNIAAFNSKGTFTFNNLQDYMNNMAVTFVQALQTASFDARQTQQFYFAHDDFRIKPNLTVNLGVRYEYSNVPFGAFGATDAESLAALVPGPVAADNDNWAPVIGFAYSPQVEGGLLGKLFGDGKTSIRGGYRIAYDVLFYNILTVNASNYPRVVVGRQDNATDVFPSLLAVSGAPVFNPLAQYVNTPADARSPYAQIYSLSIQREMFRDFQFEIGYTGSRAINAINQLQGNPAILTEAQAAQVRDTKNTGAIPSVQARRLFPQFGSRVLIATTAQSSYNAGFISLNKRLSHGLQFGFAYTYSKNISNNDESLGVGAITGGSPQVPQDYLNYGAEKSPSAFDRTHRFVVNYIYEIPWFKFGWAQAPVIKQVFSGWQFSGVTSRQSGQPFTILTGVDSNGNGGGGDRPNFNPNGAFSDDPQTGNLRTFTTSKVDGRFLVPLGNNGLPLAFSLGNGNLGKNTLRAPSLPNTDLSLSKRINTLEGQSLILRVDLFNAFNQDNYGIPVNNLNSLSFGLNTNNWGNRSLTLGAKYSF